jgi:hypothetical protein
MVLAHENTEHKCFPFLLKYTADMNVYIKKNLLTFNAMLLPTTCISTQIRVQLGKRFFPTSNFWVTRALRRHPDMFRAVMG